MKWTKIDPANVASMALSAQKRLGQLESLTELSTVGGQGQLRVEFQICFGVRV